MQWCDAPETERGRAAAKYAVAADKLLTELEREKRRLDWRAVHQFSAEALAARDAFAAMLGGELL